MSEDEIRAKIQQMCGRLDRKARAAGWYGARGALIPVVLSAGLATGACDDGQTGGEEYGAPGGYTTTSSTGTSSTGTSSTGTSSTGTGGAGGDTGGSGGATSSGGGSGGATSSGGGSGGASTSSGMGGDAGGAMEYMAPDP